MTGEAKLAQKQMMTTDALLVHQQMDRWQVMRSENVGMMTCCVHAIRPCNSLHKTTTPHNTLGNLPKARRPRTA